MPKADYRSADPFLYALRMPGRRPIWWMVLSAFALLLATGCIRQETAFDVARAWAHVEQLAGTIGSRPIGTRANVEARAYVVRELERNGFAVTIQQAVAARPERGMTARVFNVIGIAPGQTDDALALVAHYDSVADGPGAGDDAFGAAVVIEAGRVLAARDGRRHSLMIVLTDGEEAGLMGAAAFVQDGALVGRVRGYLNVEAIGSRWPAFLFETTPAATAVLDAWARHAPYPRGASFAVEIYKRLPQDTDFSILQRAGLAGLNHALIGDSYVYHTDRDDPDRLDRTAVARVGHNVVSIMAALDSVALAPLTPPPSPPIYFDVLGRVGIVYGDSARQGLLWIAVIAALTALARVATISLREAGLSRLLLTMLWMALGVAIAGAVMVGATWLLRSLREELHPWYAHPSYLLLTLLTAGGAAGLAVGRLTGHWRWHGCGHPATVWCFVLPIWIVLAVTVEWLAPSAGFMWTLPLLAAGAALTVGPVRDRSRARLTSLVVLGVACLLWMPNGLELYHFMFSILGRERVVTPVWIYPAFLVLCGLVVALPVVAVCAGRHRDQTTRHLILAVLGFVIAFPMACNAPAYTTDRPLRRFVRYVQDEAGGRAFWEVGGNEPALDVRAGSELDWQPAVLRQVQGGRGPARSPTGAPPASVAGPFRYPFVYHAATPPQERAPATVSATVDPQATRGRIAVTVVPHEAGLTATLLLPPGVIPDQPNLAGVVEARGAWRATFIGVPAEGVTFTAILDEDGVAVLSEARVIIEAARLPGLPTGVPPWLSTERTAWNRRSYFVLPLGIDD